jgi:predicted house-cleaning noncanonical NTP pyrophosphatase (MazG superfamily)
MEPEQPYVGITPIPDHGSGRSPEGLGLMGVNEKMIRDLVPSVAARNGDKISVRRAAPGEVAPLLRAKLAEELDEVMFARSDEVLGELADLVEVAYAMACAYGYSPDALDEARREKLRERGGFSQNLVMRLPEK